MPDLMNIMEVKDVDEYNAIILYLFIVAFVVKVTTNKIIIKNNNSNIQ